MFAVSISTNSSTPDALEIIYKIQSLINTFSEINHTSVSIDFSKNKNKVTKIKGKNTAMLVFKNTKLDTFKNFYEVFSTSDYIKDSNTLIQYVDDPLQTNRVIFFKYYTTNELTHKKIEILLQK